MDGMCFSDVMVNDGIACLTNNSDCDREKFITRSLFLPFVYPTHKKTKNGYDRFSMGIFQQRNSHRAIKFYGSRYYDS